MGRADAPGRCGAFPRLMQRLPADGAEWASGACGQSPAWPAASPREPAESAGAVPAQGPPQLIIVTGAVLCRAAPAETGPDRPLAADSHSPARSLGPGPALVREALSGLSANDETCLSAVLDHEVSPNTIKAYRSQWQSFTAWAQTRGIAALPADPVQVAVYLAERLEKNGHRPATLRAAASAIAFVPQCLRPAEPVRQPRGEGHHQERLQEIRQISEAGRSAHSRRSGENRGDSAPAQGGARRKAGDPAVCHAEGECGRRDGLVDARRDAASVGGRRPGVGRHRD